ncbi:hypothetical protein [Leuconostoc falkenbergense]
MGQQIIEKQIPKTPYTNFDLWHYRITILVSKAALGYLTDYEGKQINER